MAKILRCMSLIYMQSPAHVYTVQDDDTCTSIVVRQVHVLIVQTFNMKVTHHCDSRTYGIALSGPEIFSDSDRSVHVVHVVHSDLKMINTSGLYQSASCHHLSADMYT